MVVEVGEVGDVGGGEVADEEGALPVHVLDVGALLAGLQRPRRELLELGLAAAGVVRLGQPLHLVHQLVGDAMVEQLREWSVGHGSSMLRSGMLRSRCARNQLCSTGRWRIRICPRLFVMLGKGRMLCFPFRNPNTGRDSRRLTEKLKRR